MQGMVIDVTRLLSRGLDGRLPTGVDRVSLEYVRHFSHRARALVRFGWRWMELDAVGSETVFDALLSPGPGFARAVRACVAKAYCLSWSVRAHSVLLNVGHSGLDDRQYAQQLRRWSAWPIFFLHDLIPLSHPEYCRAGEAEKHLQRVMTMLNAGRGLIVNSANTQEALIQFAMQRGIKPPPIAVAPLAPAALMATAGERPLANPYFVMLGTIEPRKNHLMLLQVWRRLVETLGDQAPHLVIIGQRGWECEQVLDLLDRSYVLKNHVHEFGSCTDGELARWLLHAQALLFPSFAEGYGMPMVEALQIGVPVLASKLPVFLEIAGQVPEYLDPIDGLGWSNAILAYVDSNGSARSQQCTRIGQFQAPTWRQHFEAVESLLERVSAKGVRI